jgi:predicted nuclease with TOPRIM domain
MQKMMGEASNILIAVIAVGAALGGLILTSSRGLRQEMTQMEARLREDMSRLREDMTRLREDITRLGERVARLEHGQAKLEGLLEGLREAITGRTASS